MRVSYNGYHFTPTQSSISLQHNPVNLSAVFILVSPRERKRSEISDCRKDQKSSESRIPLKFLFVATPGGEAL